MREKIKRLRPSPAMLVAVAALVLAVSGVAVGLPGKKRVDKNDIKKGAVRSKAIKKGAVTRSKIANKAISTGKLAKDAVTTAKIQRDAVTTARIKDGEVTAAKLAPGAVPRAYALITNATGTSPTLLGSNSKGIAQSNVTQEAAAYCIRGLGFTPKSVQATLYHPGTAPEIDIVNASTNPPQDFAGCSGAEQAHVSFYTPAGAPDATPPGVLLTLFD